MDGLAWITFLAATFLFSAFIAMVLKITLGKYLTELTNVPTFYWAILLSVVMVALELSGAVDVAGFYAWFFGEISRLLGGGA